MAILEAVMVFRYARRVPPMAAASKTWMRVSPMTTA
jgi:hypothetical protein